MYISKLRLHASFLQLINIVPALRPTRCTCYLKVFILVKRSTCFGRYFHPSSGARNCVYSIRRMSNSCCYLLLSGIRWNAVPSHPRCSREQQLFDICL